MSQRELFPRAEPRMGDVERAAHLAGHRLIIGVDEAGRGPLAGPVSVGAVVFAREVFEQEDPEAWWRQLDDSKKLSEKRREALFDLIQQHALASCVILADRSRIDTLNILNATKAAMSEAVETVLDQLRPHHQVDHVYIDGNQYIETELPQSAVIKGDGRSYHIAAASILAKVTRDRLMVAYHERWPEYGFAGHKGYGTKAHLAAIVTHGPCAIHRQSFAGVKEHLERLRVDEDAAP